LWGRRELTVAQVGVAEARRFLRSRRTKHWPASQVVGVAAPFFFRRWPAGH